RRRRALRVRTRLGDPARPSSELGEVTLPFVEQPLDVPTLFVRERVARDDTPRFGRIVVLDRRLEVLAEHVRLAQLPAQPAEQADLRGAAHRLRAQINSLPSVVNPSRS